MFIRKRGKRYLILRSYRDGRGKVCQSRLGHFCDRAGLERQLAEMPWDAHVDQLRERAEQLLVPVSTSQPAARAEKIRRAVGSLLTLLAEESDVEVLREAEEALLVLRTRLSEESVESPVDAARSRLSPRRRQHHEKTPQAEGFVQALDRQAQVLLERGELEQCEEVLAERNRCRESRETRLSHGSVLQRLGRVTEALEQYGRIPQRSGWRHYNQASAYWQQGEADLALVSLMRGMIRCPDAVEALQRKEKGQPPGEGADYWQEFGELWPEEGRRFILFIASQMLIRRRLRQSQESGIWRRNLVPAYSRVWLLERAAEAIKVWKSASAQPNRSLRGNRRDSYKPVR